MRRTKEDAAQTKQTILNAALAIFSRKGFQATTLNDIAQEAGTTRGAIYHHFENKAGLYKALIIDASAQGNEALQTAVSQGGTFQEISRRIFEVSLNLLAENERFRQVSALSLYRTGISEELADVEQMRLEQAKSMVEGIAALMQTGIEQGEIRDDIDAETIARAFLSFQNGVAWLWLAGGEHFSIQQAAPAMADILFNGIGQP